MSNKQKQHAINYLNPIEDIILYDNMISYINQIDINKSTSSTQSTQSTHSTQITQINPSNDSTPKNNN